MNKIYFQPIYYDAPEWITGFVPAKLHLPEWYKKMPLYVNDDGKSGLGPIDPQATNKTLKSCSPFLDALTTGYIYELSQDVEIRKTIDSVAIRWRTSNDLVSVHDLEQHKNLPTPQEGKWEDVFKWYNPFNIKTPKGYSCLFTHPFNRYDLPFRTLTGIVETDTYTNAVQFPFQVIEFDEPFIILEKGTPLAQVLPFKRDDWKIERQNYDSKFAAKSSHELFSKIVRSYKSQWWVRKNYN